VRDLHRLLFQFVLERVATMKSSVCELGLERPPDMDLSCCKSIVKDIMLFSRASWSAQPETFAVLLADTDLSSEISKPNHSHFLASGRSDSS
jgi:hypothetical protein